MIPARPAPSRYGLWLLVVLVASLVVGCRDSAAPSIDTFVQAWDKAAQNNDPAAIYALLDAQSRRWIEYELEELRGLPPEAQQAVLDQLGDMKAQSLLDVTPQAYFSRLWQHATGGQWPKMEPAVDAADSAYVMMQLQGGQPQQVRLAVEGGRWVWMLPRQRISRFVEDAGSE